MRIRDYERALSFLNGFQVGVNVMAIIFLIIWLLTSCHPYPYKSIKPDKTKHAQFR